jgi:glutamate/aspartate transport system substrate-binding protein
LLTRQNSNIKDFADLSGRRALVFGNTTTEHLLRKFSSEKKTPFEVVVTMDLSTPPIIQLQSGQVDAYMGDDIVLYGYIGNSARPQDWIVTGTALSREAYGCVMRKDSPQFKAIVDAAIADWMRSGQAAMSYKRWFQSPTPPDGINLNFPMSSDMEYLFRNPNDRAFD